MDAQILKIEDRLEQHCKSIHRFDEELFNLGVEMGRLLERNNIPLHRPKIFVEFEEKNNAFDRKNAQINRIEKVVAFLIRNAVAEQVENHFEFDFDSNASSHSCDKLDDSIVEKFGVQVSRTTQREHGGSFETNFTLSGQVADILKKYDLDVNARADVDNSSGDEHETIYSAEDVDRIFGVSIGLNAHNTDLDEAQLTALADEIEQIHTWFSLSLKNPR